MNWQVGENLQEEQPAREVWHHYGLKTLSPFLDVTQDPNNKVNLDCYHNEYIAKQK